MGTAGILILLGLTLAVGRSGAADPVDGSVLTQAQLQIQPEPTVPPQTPFQNMSQAQFQNQSQIQLQNQSQTQLEVLPQAQAVSGAQMGQIRDYGRQVGEGWLKNALGVNLEAMQIVWDPETESFVTAGDLEARGNSGAAGRTETHGSASSPALNRGISLKLTQTDDITHLAEGVRDVPFGLEVKGTFRMLAFLSAMDTRLNVPLSPNDAWRASASLPVDLWGATGTTWWRDMGLGKQLAFRSDISSRLGLNQWEAGLGTKWNPGFIGIWKLDYDWRRSYGQGSDEMTQWLKLSKEF